MCHGWTPALKHCNQGQSRILAKLHMKARTFEGSPSAKYYDKLQSNTKKAQLNKNNRCLCAAGVNTHLEKVCQSSSPRGLFRSISGPSIVRLQQQMNFTSCEKFLFYFYLFISALWSMNKSCMWKISVFKGLSVLADGFGHFKSEMKAREKYSRLDFWKQMRRVCIINIAFRWTDTKEAGNYEKQRAWWEL